MSEVTKNRVVTDEKGRWLVMKEGTDRAWRVFDNQKAAVIYARKLSKSEHGELIIHNVNGEIVSIDSFKSAASPITITNRKRKTHSAKE